MNKCFKIFAGIAAVMALASCNKEVEYQTSSFVTFTTTAATVQEDAGVVEIPIYAYAENVDLSFPREGSTTSVSFQIVDNTAKNGVNFTVEPASGVVEFSNATQAVIKLNVTNLAGEYTGNLNFSIALTGANNDFTIGGLNTMTVTIKDLDHPLSAVFGTYTTSGTDYWGEPYSFDVTVGPIDGSATAVAIQNLCPAAGSYIGGHYAVAEVSSDMTTWTAASDQLLGVYSGAYNFYFSNPDADKVVFTYDQATGKLSTEGLYGSMSPEAGGWFEIYSAPVFTKK